MRINNQIDLVEDLRLMSYAPAYNAWIYHHFHPYIGSHCLEVGCGSGNILAYYAPYIRQGVVLEPDKKNSAIAADIIRDNAWNISVFTGTLDDYCEKDIKDKSSFDTIIYSNVLEHIEQDKHEIELCEKMLRTAGKLLLFLPACPWLFTTIDKELGHYRRYSKDTVKTLFKNTGFDITVIRYVNFLGIFAWLYNMSFKRHTQSEAVIKAGSRWVVPVLDIVDTLVLHTVGMSLFCVAEKKK